MCYEFCWHFWHRSASIVTVLTCNRPEVSGKHEGASDKTKQYTQGVAYRGESPASLSGFFCRQAYRALNSPHSLLSQEVCLTLSLGDDVWADSKSTGLITLAKYSGKYSTLTHMCSINHLYNACHIKCYYDCGLESVSAVLNLARFQECLVALRPPPPSPTHPPTINLSMGAIHACRCVSECEFGEWQLCSLALMDLTCTSWVGAKDRFTEFLLWHFRSRRQSSGSESFLW